MVDGTSEERWLPVMGYEGIYEISDLGRIRSLDRVVVDDMVAGLRIRRFRGRMLKPYPVGALREGVRPYLGFRLCREGTVTPVKIQTLVAEAFIGPRPDGLVIRHKNDDGRDNRAVNLEYGTYTDNMIDALRNGGRKLKVRCKWGHLRTVENVNKNGNCKTCARSRPKAARRTGASRPAFASPHPGRRQGSSPAAGQPS